MASLTQSAITARKGVRWTIYGAILFLVGRIVFGIVAGVIATIFPKAPPPPTHLFGPLPKISFPENRADPSKLTYTLQTPEGGLSEFNLTQAKVFYMPKEQPNLFSVQEGLKKARPLGFTTSEQKITDTLYKFSHPNLPKILEINVVSNIFSLSYDLAADPTPIDAIPPFPEGAASTVRSYLSGAQLLPEDLTGPITHKYVKVEGGKLVPAISQSEANLIEINLFRESYDDLPSLTSDVGEANVWFLVSGSTQSDRKILSGEFRYFPIDKEKYSTYKIRTSQEAWNDLVAGKAFIAKSPSEGNVVIRRVYLAYYDPETPSEFFQPVVVFEGDDFTAYVPAVTKEYYPEN